MSSYSEGQTHQLMEALERSGWTPEDVTRLGQFPDLADLRAVIRGQTEIEMVKYPINLDAPPFIPRGWSVVEHKKGGRLGWDPARVLLHLEPEQKEGVISGKTLRQRLAGKSVANANLLDYLLDHPGLIPEDWKGNFVFFWGTIYRAPDGDLLVRYLAWSGRRWHWDLHGLGDDWGGVDPAVVLAS